MSLEITEALIARQPPESQAIIRLLMGQFKALEAKVAKLEAKVERLKRTERNSSLPPSSQHPHAKEPTLKPKSARKQGGQPGHPKAERALIPSEQCANVIPCKPAACRRCHTKLAGDDLLPLRHQVWELPEIKPLVMLALLVHFVRRPGLS